MFLHCQRFCEPGHSGERTRIRAFVPAMRGAVIGRDCQLGGGSYVEAAAAPPVQLRAGAPR